MFHMPTFIRIVIALSLALPGLAAGAEKAPDGMVLIPGGEFLMGSLAEEVAKMKKKFGISVDGTTLSMQKRQTESFYGG